VKNKMAIKALFYGEVNLMKEYLFYIKGEREMGSEGWASYLWYGVGRGNTLEESIEDYRKKIEIDATQFIRNANKNNPNYQNYVSSFNFYKKDDKWYESYGYELAYVELKQEEYMDCKNIKIIYE
jgi:hypothetical protein